jgi:hypothetical protein
MSSIVQAGPSYKEVLNYLSGQPVFSSKSVTLGQSGFWSTIRNSANVYLAINGRTYWQFVHKCPNGGTTNYYNQSPTGGEYDTNKKVWTKDSTVFQYMNCNGQAGQTFQSHGNHDISYNGTHLYPYVSTTGSN